MGWTAINDEENPVFGANHQSPKKLDESIGIHAAFLNLIWPREVTAEIRLKVAAGIVIRAHMRRVSEINKQAAEPM
jgi:hypothetical protein